MWLHVPNQTTSTPSPSAQGGGGLDIGLELAAPSLRSVVMVEREAFAAAHLVAAMQEGLLAPAPVWSDVATFAGRGWRGLVDGVVGGIPCQPHSLAGSRLGEDDERDLWSDARRIIVQSGAWFVLIENVEGMLTSGGAERVVRDLRRLGFAVEIGLFSASEVGAPHQRNRVFILAVADRAGVGLGGRAGSEPAEPGGDRRTDADHNGVELADAGGAGLEVRLRERCLPRPEFAAAERNCGELANPACGRRRREGDADEPPPGSAVASRTMDDATGLGDGAVSIQQGQPRRTGPDAPGPGASASLGLFPPGPADIDGWRGTLAHSPHLEPAVRRMADGVAARLDLAGPHAARVERLRLLGNGVVPLQAAYAFRTLCARLAARGSAGAARLVRVMECA